MGHRAAEELLFEIPTNHSDEEVLQCNKISFISMHPAALVAVQSGAKAS